MNIKQGSFILKIGERYTENRQFHIDECKYSNEWIQLTGITDAAYLSICIFMKEKEN